MTNYKAVVLALYWNPNESNNPEPNKIKIELYGKGLISSKVLSTNNLTDKGICKAFPQINISHNRKSIIEDIHYQYHHILQKHKSTRKYCIEQHGLQKIDNNLCYVFADQLIGKCNNDFIIDPSNKYYTKTSNIDNPLTKLCKELYNVDKNVLIGIAFLFTSLIRSWITEQTDSWQAVLAITAKQSYGKTTLAHKLTDWIVNNQNQPCLQFSAGSTQAAIRDMLINAKDLPVVIDDLCLSASSSLQRNYHHIASAFVREGSNSAGIIKKNSKGGTTQLNCKAGVILTAEFALENASDITRTIYLRIKHPLNLTDTLSSELIGSACIDFLKWFMNNEAKAKIILSEMLLKKSNFDNINYRVQRNFSILDTVFQLFILAAKECNLDSKYEKSLNNNFHKALCKSISYQQDLLSECHKPELADVILSCCEKKAFNLCKKKRKISNHDGVICDNNLYIRSNALESIVSMQKGCSSYTLSSMIKKLNQYNAIVIHEDGTYQCKIYNVRVYHINLKALKYYSKKNNK